MEPDLSQLPQTVLSSILLRSDLSSFENLTNTSKTMQNTLRSTVISEYNNKLMLEDLLGIDIPMQYHDWKGAYEFVLATQPDVKMLFTKDVFHAQLGLELVTDIDEAIIQSIETAELETIKYLMTESKLANDDRWKDHDILSMCVSILLREDVALMVIEDGRCFQRMYRASISLDIYTAANNGLSKVYFRLIELYPDEIPEDIGAAFIGACSSGARDIADNISKFVNDLDDDEIQRGYSILELYNGSTKKSYYNDSEYADISVSILNGKTNKAVTIYLEGQRAKTIVSTLSPGIMSGKIYDIEYVLPYLNIGGVVQGLLYIAIAAVTVEYIEGANHLALQLFNLLTDEARAKLAIRKAIAKGKIELAKQMQQSLNGR